MSLKKRKKTDGFSQEKKISRKEAIKKTGLFAATAATTLFLLGSPNKAAAGTSDVPIPPVWP